MFLAWVVSLEQHCNNFDDTYWALIGRPEAVLSDQKQRKRQRRIINTSSPNPGSRCRPHDVRPFGTVPGRQVSRELPANAGETGHLTGLFPYKALSAQADKAEQRNNNDNSANDVDDLVQRISLPGIEGCIRRNAAPGGCDFK